MNKQNLLGLVESYKDFPSKGIIFRDLTPILRNPELLNQLISDMSNVDFCKDAEAIISIDARGFVFGSMISMCLSKPMILARKQS